jgi:hypothetical protein
VPDQVDHPAEKLAVGGFIGLEVYDSGDAAHGEKDKCLKFGKTKKRRAVLGSWCREKKFRECWTPDRVVGFEGFIGFVGLEIGAQCMVNERDADASAFAVGPFPDAPARRSDIVGG